MKNFFTRAVTGLLYVVLLVGCTIWGPESAYLFFAIVAAGCVFEFGTITNRNYHASMNRTICAMATVVLYSAMWAVQTGVGDSRKMFALYGFTLLYLLVSELYRRCDDPIRNWSLAFASQIFIALPFSLIPLVSLHYDAVEGCLQYDWIYTLAIFVCLWTNDTGAYLVGSLLGRYIPHKLFPRISPHKSWVGSIGGSIVSLVAAAAIWYFAHGLTLAQWMGLAAVVCIVGTWGDLVESLIKRQLGIKDSGKILPGHGGLLDRFDSALLAIPASYVYLTFI